MTYRGKCLLTVTVSAGTLDMCALVVLIVHGVASTSWGIQNFVQQGGYLLACK